MLEPAKTLWPVKRLPTSILFEVLRDPLSSMLRIPRDFGDMAEFRFGRYAVVVVSHPDLIREVLVTKNTSFGKSRSMQFGRKLMGKGLPASESEFHRAQRRTIQPSFSHQNLSEYMRVATAYSREAIGKWEEGTPFEFREEMMRLTLSIAMKTLFGEDNRDEIEGTRGALVRSIGHFVLQYYLRIFYFNQNRNPFADFVEVLPVGENRRYRKARKLLDESIDLLISRRRSEGVDRGDLLSVLLGSPGYTGGDPQLSDEQIHDEVMTFLLAAHDTTASALTWAVHLLLGNPDSWRLLRMEALIDGSASKGKNAHAELDYASKVFNEAVRLYPPAWIIGRQAIQSCEIGGNPISKGTTILMSQYAVHHDPRFFPEPWAFRPERWSRDYSEAISKFAYFPFGGGPRACIGEGFARAMAAVILTTIASMWDLELADRPPIVPYARVTLRPRYGMVVVPRRRAEASASMPQTSGS